jgi:16S rRNA processing protein RimM
MQYNSIGKIVASFGVNGELVLRHALGKKTALKGLEIIFVEVHKDEFLPYFIVSARAKNDAEIFLALEGVSTREAALALNQKEVWLAEEDFKRYAAKTASISLLGFHIINDGEDIGEILEVIEQPHQVLCRIDLDGKEALIPVHASSLLKMDTKKKQVFLDLPDGLLDLYR